jgi:hypothetical protein
VIGQHSVPQDKESGGHHAGLLILHGPFTEPSTLGHTPDPLEQQRADHNIVGWTRGVFEGADDKI